MSYHNWRRMEQEPLYPRIVVAGGVQPGRPTSGFLSQLLPQYYSINR